MYKIATVAVLETLWLLKNNRSYSASIGVKIMSTLASYAYYNQDFLYLCIGLSCNALFSHLQRLDS